MSRVILLASARSYRNAAFTAAADKLGLEVAVGLDVPPPLIAKMPGCFALDYRDPDRALRTIARYTAERPARAVLGVDDSATVLAARAAAALGLPHNAPEAAEAASDKAQMRRAFAASAVPSPRFHEAAITTDPEEVLEALEAAGLGFPCVLKPTFLSGSRGVMRADTPQEFIERFYRLRRLLATTGGSAILVERFIPGVEVAVEGLLDGGRLHVLAVFDKPDPLDGPFFEETLYITPSRLPAAAQAALRRTAEQACLALGLREGPVHAELRVAEADRADGGEVAVVEVAARSIGGLCSRILRFAEQAEATLEELILRQACGLPLPLEQPAGAGGVMMIPIPGAGLLRAVHGLEAARATPLIDEIEITAPLNYPLVPLPEGEAYLGFIFARGETPAAVEAALRTAHGCLRFEITPELPLWPAAR